MRKHGTSRSLKEKVRSLKEKAYVTGVESDADNGET